MDTALPLTSPYAQPVYSTLAFTLIALALNGKTGMTYEEMLDEMICVHLDLRTPVSPRGILQRLSFHLSAQRSKDGVQTMV